MRMRWRLLLPIFALLLFVGITLQSYRVQRETIAASGRYFFWSTIRLDFDPLNRHHQAPCANSQEPCVDWDISDADGWGRVHPGRLEKVLILSALPAFLVGSLVVFGLGRIGVSEVTTFMLSMPLLICVWFYCIGLLVDRRAYRRSWKAVAELADKS
jgi:hypothetical protein